VVLQHLERAGALPGDDGGVVVGVDVGAALVPGQPQGLVLGLLQPGWAWFPADMATTPLARSPSESWSNLLRAPRSLNEAMNCRFSNFTTAWHPSTSERVREWALGVRSIAPA
jgi:hypothetical protein